MDQYEKGVVLGRGTFGSVYKAVHKKVHRIAQNQQAKLLLPLPMLTLTRMTLLPLPLPRLLSVTGTLMLMPPQ